MTAAFNLSQHANFIDTTGKLDASTGLYNTASLAFPAGTVMLFAQTSAPTGWAKSTTHDNKALRVVSGTAGSGGSVAFTNAFASGLSDGATTLTTAQMPSHNHTVTLSLSGGGGPIATVQPAEAGSPVAMPTSSTGGGGSHTHSLPSFAVSYVDVIIATKA